MYPLSPQQRRLWSRSSQTLNWISFELDGPLDPARLAESIATHDILRMAFRRRAGVKTPLQVVGEPYTPVIEAPGDWTSAAPADRFDGQPLRVQCASTTVTLSLPAVCSDGPTLLLLARELAYGVPAGRTPDYIRYAAWRNGLPTEVPDARPLAMFEGPPGCADAQQPVDWTEWIPVRDFDRDTLFAKWTSFVRAHHERDVSVVCILDGRVHDDLRNLAGPASSAVPDASGIGFESIDLPRDIRIHDLVTTGDPCPVKLLCIAGDELRVRLVFDSARYRKRDMRERLRAFVQWLDEPTIITKREERRMLALGRGPRRDFGRNTTALDLLRECVERNPDAPAVVGSLSYGELWSAAQTLAQTFADDGPVPVPANPTADLVIAMVASWLAGRAYVPLDPANHPARTRAMLDECGVAQDRSSAYIIFTSGSTGTPKGVMVSQQALANYASWLGSEFGLGPDDRSLLLTSPAFDLGYTAIWGTLLRGGALVLPPEEVRTDAARWLDFVVEHGVTYLKLTPSMFHALVAEAQPDFLRKATNLRLILLGGEPLRTADVDAVLRVRPDLTFVNHYGPTEATVGCVAWRVKPGMRPVIGRPIANASAYILDAELRPVPYGVTGTLYIAGPGLATGYASRPGLTAERFLPNPFARGERMYCTGDRARWTGSGHIEYLGRADRQVKVSGHRVELAEIEAALTEHPETGAAAVFPEGETLTALLVPDGPKASLVSALCRLTPEERAQTTTLSNGLVVSSYRHAETDMLYREIFADNIYGRHGIRLDPGDIVLDAGANIGMSSLWAGLAAPDVCIHSFEPIPETFKHLQTNAALYPLDWQVHPLAMGKAPGVARFTCYRDHSMLATTRPDDDADRELLLSLSRGNADESLIRDQLATAQIDCPVTTLSDFLAQHAIAEVALLKIDVQRGERDVLEGIADGDWPRIRQIVVETHDSALAGLLRERGFNVIAEKNLLYATRIASRSAAPGPMPWLSPRALAESVRHFLTARLPPFMIPGKIAFINALPRTANGKVDRQALTALPGAALDAEPPLTPPSGPRALALAELWREVLNADAVGLESNFYNLGGHSLLAARLVNRMSQTLGVKPRLADVLRNPAFADMLRLLEPSPVIGDEPIARAPRQPFEPLTPAARSLFVVAQIPGGNAAYNVFRALRVAGPLDVDRLEHAIADCVRRHESLRTGIVLHDGEPMQRVNEPSFQLERRTCGSADECRPVAEAEARRAFDLFGPSLFRAVLLSVTPHDHILLLTVHHIVSDGWSVEVLSGEIFERYDELAADPDAPLAELPFQFRDFRHHRELHRTGDRAHLDYWLQKLDGFPWHRSLRTDRPRSADAGFLGSSLRFETDPQIWKRVQAAGEQRKIGPFAMLLAAVNVLLYGWSGERDILVATNATGRDDSRLRNQIGYYADTLLHRNLLDPGQPFSALAAGVLQTGVEALDHAIPLEALVSALPVHRRNGRAVLFDVGFTWYDIEARTDLAQLGKASGLEITPWPTEYFPARTDLWFFADPGPGRLSWNVVYNRALFDAATAAGLRDGLLRILRQVAADCDVAVREIAPRAPVSESTIPLNI